MIVLSTLILQTLAPYIFKLTIKYLLYYLDSGVQRTDLDPPTLMAASRVSSTTSIRRSLCSYKRFCSSAALFSNFTCSTAVKLFCNQSNEK